MARRSLKPQLNQIRAWVQQGRTDAWIAHQLEISASELREFRKQHDLNPDEENGGTGEVDLRDEIEAEVEAATAEEAEEEEKAEDEDDEEADEKADRDEDEDEDEDEEPEEEKKPARSRKKPAARKRKPATKRESSGKGETGKREADGDGEGGARPRRRRRRGRRGGRGRRKEIEATFDHGERDGYGLWLDPSVKDNPVYAERWAGKREVTVRIEADQIVIRRAGEPSGGSDSDE